MSGDGDALSEIEAVRLERDAILLGVVQMISPRACSEILNNLDELKEIVRRRRRFVAAVGSTQNIGQPLSADGQGFSAGNERGENNA